MTDEEQDQIIGADFRARRNAERKLACLESKREAIKRNIKLMATVFDDGVVTDSVSGCTLHTHDGASTNRQHQVIVFPSANEVLELVREMDETRREISEINQRLAKV